MDCEMVGLGPCRESGLARCSLVDLHGTVLYDKFIRPEGEITDYRTLVSGVTPWHMEEATPFAVARLEVSGGGQRATQARARGGEAGKLRLPACPPHTHFLAAHPAVSSATCDPSYDRLPIRVCITRAGRDLWCLLHVPEQETT